ncbi:MAG: bifunctional phosphopantothenoylcysteine decarboxylase/phosphopantothenate--cysteine ligase CoaBC [Bacteroidetes bacterium]|nr:bifunctional phosphopantothenoylcysteine decarboxylase/phosphopantothenate--cysteine ligase CoaBC [Bacteroidota bacterium]MBS1630619.1 bifunctional phosphopantothenoylcysteine decarboxylase/phosphopantothenate--cysteine ligase CoaBC [Bacteroidota bacterium]
MKGKNILLAVTGSIAAYKTPQLVRLLVKAGADVKVLLTDSARDFVSPLALSTVSKHEVHSSVHDGSQWNNHVALGRWADALLIAPCSANTLAKLAQGLCDNLVCAAYLSAACPVFIAPAMDEDMWLHASTQANISLLKSRGNRLIPVAHGELASGLIGEGRMSEPDVLLDFLEKFFSKEDNKPLKGKKALVTAGPTYERLDPVRFIGNFSSGKMGISLAEALAAQGAEVSLLLGPTHLQTTETGIQTLRVESAQEMYEAALKLFPDCSIAVMAAAVADYKPAQAATEKIKKQDTPLALQLMRTPDILKALGQQKKASQLLIGFALETNDEEQYAFEKLRNKGADLMVLNSLRDAGAGFGHDTNKVSLLRPDGSVESLPLLPKATVAQAIVQAILQQKNESRVS